MFHARAGSLNHLVTRLSAARPSGGFKAVLEGTGGSTEAQEFVEKRRKLNGHKLVPPPAAPVD